MQMKIATFTSLLHSGTCIFNNWMESKSTGILIEDGDSFVVAIYISWVDILVYILLCRFYQYMCRLSPWSNPKVYKDKVAVNKAIVISTQIQ